MKKFLTTLCAVAALCTIASAAFASNQVRISQIYGGGGAAGAGPTYNRDYVEIYNSGGTAVSVGGWTIEYGSAAGNWGSTALNIFTFPAGTSIAPCSYLLVAMTASAGGGALPIVPDFSGTLTLSSTDGKIALFNAVNTNLACGFENAGTLVDKIAYGAGNCPEVTSTAVLTTTSGDVRKLGGGQDTDNNVNDFTVTANPVPRNSQSAQNPLCVSANFGACCLRNTTTGACVMVTSGPACDALVGIFLGLGTSCTPTPCATPATHHTWGQVKSIYR